jgi:hypothetical protein
MAAMAWTDGGSMSASGPASTSTMANPGTSMTRRAAKHATAVSAPLISTGTRGSYGRGSGSAPASHVTHDSQQPMALDRPSAVMTHGRLLQGG